MSAKGRSRARISPEARSAEGSPLTTRVRVACVGFVFDPAAEAVIRHVAPPGLDLTFVPQPDRLTVETLAASDILLTVAPVTDEMMGSAPRLRLIQKWGTGYEKIDIQAAARHGITVAITAGANADTIAEHAITLMLAVMRRVVVADRALRAGRWIPSELRPVSRRLFGKTVGIIGFGNIGRAVARQLQGFKSTVLYHERGGRLRERSRARGDLRQPPRSCWRAATSFRCIAQGAPRTAT